MLHGNNMEEPIPMVVSSVENEFESASEPPATDFTNSSVDDVSEGYSCLKKITVF